MKTLIHLSLLSLALTACSGTNSPSARQSTSSKSNPVQVVTTVKNHSVEECPKFAAAYMRSIDGRIETKRFSSVVIHENGLYFIEDKNPVEVNGEAVTHNRRGLIYYVGYCIDKKIVLDIFAERNLIGSTTYTLSNNGKLSITSVFTDPKLKSSGTETWDPLNR